MDASAGETSDVVGELSPNSLAEGEIEAEVSLEANLGDWCPDINAGVGKLFDDVRTAIQHDFPAVASSTDESIEKLTNWFTKLVESARAAAAPAVSEFEADFADFGEDDAFEKVGERLPDFSTSANRSFNPSLDSNPSMVT